MTHIAQNKTPLYNKHVQQGAKMTDFHGWLLPMQFASIIDECKAVRKSAGLFDISHMGKAEVKGQNAMKLLQNLTVNDISTLTEGKAQYNALVNEKGGIIDDLVIYHVSRTRYFLCLNAANTDKDVEWIAEFALQYPDVEVRNLSRQYGLLALQGPNAEAIMRNITSNKISSLEYFGFTHVSLADRNVMVSRTGYTGEDGFELYCDWRDTETIWDLIMSKGRQWGVKPIGLGARDILRLEMGYMLHGQDMDSTLTPYETGLEWIVRLEKEGGLVALDALKERKATGPAKRIVGFEVEERGGIPRHGFHILANGRIIGQVTSGAMSPNSGKIIGMGYVHPDFAAPGTAIQIDIRDKAVAARVARRPFLPARTKKKPQVGPKPSLAPEKA